MHAKSDSDVTSLPACYFVQSPSRESSHDGEKMSFQSTPVLSPAASPSHPSSVGRHSRASSASRFSGNLRPPVGGGRKINSNGKLNSKGWPECNVIEEEGPYDEEGRKGLSRRCYGFLFLACFAVLFAIFSLALWGASRPYKPQVTMKSIVFSNFYVAEGADETGVPTKMVTLNCSVKLNVYNPATFFGIHVGSTPVHLMYSQLSIGTGQLKKYYQSRKSHHTVSIVVEGVKTPLYGAGGSLSSSDSNGGIPMELVFGIRSKAYVLGKLVKPKFQKNIHCQFVLDSIKLKPIRLQKVCHGG